jgi:hypothetical protein
LTDNHNFAVLPPIREGTHSMKPVTLASALAAIGVLCCISPPGAEAGTLPPGYPAYIPVDQYYASQGLGLISATVVFDEVITGDDNNGGYVLRETTWGTVYSEPSPFSINDGGYTANGYVNAGLPIPLTPGTNPIATQPPATTPPAKTTAQKVKWAELGATYALYAASAKELAAQNSAVGNEVAAAALLVVSGVLSGISAHYFALAADPADSDYTEIVTLASLPTLAVPNIPGSTPAETAAWSDLITNTEDVSVLPDAIETSFDRAEGAFDASAPQFWVDLQMEAFNGYDQLADADTANIEADANILGLNTPAAAPVPEPGSLALLGSALFSLMVIRPRHLGFLRRRRDASAVA